MMEDGIIASLSGSVDGFVASGVIPTMALVSHMFGKNPHWIGAWGFMGLLMGFGGVC
jgi:hypothetical protein